MKTAEEYLNDADTELKTSAEWQALYPNPVVMDPDGWDRKNYQYSWFEEKITLQEYENRLLTSTCRITITQVIKMNTLFAEFMGVVEQETSYNSYGFPARLWYTANGLFRTDTFSVPGKSLRLFCELAKYNTSYDWLMPVWYKFKDLDSYSLELSEWSIYRYYWNTIANDIPRKPIADVCKLLAEGIRWYNSTQNKES